MTANPNDSISVLELLEIGNQAKLDRAANAAERAAHALDSIALSFEKLTALASSVIGTGYIDANVPHDGFATKLGHFIRTGSGRKTFRDEVDDSDDQ